MDAKNEFMLFKRRTYVRPVLFRSVVAQVPADGETSLQREANGPFQKLRFALEKERLATSPDKKFSNDLLNDVQQKNSTESNTQLNPHNKIDCLSALLKSLKRLEACLRHKKNRASFLNHNSVQLVSNVLFKSCVTNLKRELDLAISVCPVTAEVRQDFSTRTDLIKDRIRLFQNYASEFKEKWLLSEEHGHADLAEIDRLVDEIVEDMKLAIESYSADIPFFERCLILFLNEHDASVSPDRKPFMRYESSKGIWPLSQVEYKNPEFFEDVLQERLASLKASLHIEHLRGGVKLAEEITKFASNKQLLLQEINTRLHILKVSPAEPQASLEQENEYTYRPTN